MYGVGGAEISKRCYSVSLHLNRYEETKKKRRNLLMAEHEIAEFDQTLELLIDDLKTEAKEKKSMSSVMRRYIEAIRYNVTTGKKTRGLSVIAAYKAIERPDLLTKENIVKANILGWAVEILQGFLLVMDDIVDGSKTRRGNACWYRKPSIGLHAVTDALLLESGLYVTLRKHLSGHGAYRHVTELFRNSTFVTVYGQLLDAGAGAGLDSFDMRRFNDVAEYKTSHYSFRLPLSAAMCLAGNTDPLAHKQSDEIMTELGRFFQAQDDYIDCFGDPEQTGKLGTDIETGKCTWLIAKALEVAAPDQIETLRKNYGKDDPESVATVKNVYRELELPNLFRQFEETSHANIVAKIEKYSRDLPANFLNNLVTSIFKRIC